MAKVYLTEKKIKKVPITAQLQLISDDPKSGGEIGLHIEILPSGRRVFFWRRAKGRKQRRIAIGEFPSISLVRARELARELNVKLAKQELGKEDTTISLKNFWEIHYKPKALVKLAPTTQRNYGIAWEKLRPLHHLNLQEISRKAVAQLFSDIGETCPPMANTVRAVLSAILNRAIEWGYLDSCPALPKRFQEKKRERYLTKEEIDRMIAVLNRYDPLYGLYFMTCLYTGSRKMEVCRMRWDQIDLDAGCWIRVQKGDRLAPTSLCEDLIELLRNWKARQDNDPDSAGTAWVFQSPTRKNHHIVEPTKRWKEICKLAGIRGATIHTLRHTLGTWLAQDGGGTQLKIARQLGHSQISTTERYVHLSGKDTKPLVDSVTKKMTNSVRYTLPNLKKKAG